MYLAHLEQGVILSGRARHQATHTATEEARKGCNRLDGELILAATYFNRGDARLVQVLLVLLNHHHVVVVPPDEDR